MYNIKGKTDASYEEIQGSQKPTLKIHDQEVSASWYVINNTYTADLFLYNTSIYSMNVSVGWMPQTTDFLQSQLSNAGLSRSTL